MNGSRLLLPPRDFAVKRFERYHRSHSSRWNQPDCWRCGRAKAICRSKIQYEAKDDAWLTVDRMHAENDFAEPMVAYCCKVCGWWHVAHAYGHEVKKSRRRWALVQAGKPLNHAQWLAAQ